MLNANNFFGESQLKNSSQNAQTRQNTQTANTNANFSKIFIDDQSLYTEL